MIKSRPSYSESFISIIWLLLLLIFSVTVSIFYGSFPVVSDGLIFNLSQQQYVILFELRVPRVICCAIVGALLSCCGVISQSILRNPLACPYTLGISQLVSLLIFTAFFVGLYASFLLGLIFLISVIYFSSRARKLEYAPGNTMLLIILIGLATGTFCSSIILGLQFLLDGISLMQMTRWLMGNLVVVGYYPLIPLFAVSLIMFLVCYYRARDLDWLMLGDELALSRGVDLRKNYLILAGLVFFAVSVVVWTVGPIGFVGLIVPHATRLLGFIKHRFLLPGSALIGASFLCLSDLFSRVFFSPLEIPIGVITGVIGAPIFVFILTRNLTRQ